MIHTKTLKETIGQFCHCSASLPGLESTVAPVFLTLVCVDEKDLSDLALV